MSVETQLATACLYVTRNGGAVVLVLKAIQGIRINNYICLL